jgi:hypothetical protein
MITRDGAIYYIFYLLQLFYNAKVYFLRLMRVYAVLLMLAACTLSRFPFPFLFGQQGLGHFSRYRPLLLIGWGIVPVVR